MSSLIQRQADKRTNTRSLKVVNPQLLRELQQWMRDTLWKQWQQLSADQRDAFLLEDAISNKMRELRIDDPARVSDLVSEFKQMAHQETQTNPSPLGGSSSSNQSRPGYQPPVQTVVNSMDRLRVAADPKPTQDTVNMDQDTTPTDATATTTEVVGSNSPPTRQDNQTVNDMPRSPRTRNTAPSTVSGGTPLAGYPYSHPVNTPVPKMRRRPNEGAWTGAKRPRYPTVHRPFTNSTHRLIVGNRSHITRMHSLGYDKDIVRSHPVPPFIPPSAALGQRGSAEIVSRIPSLQPGAHHWLFG